MHLKINKGANGTDLVLSGRLDRGAITDLRKALDAGPTAGVWRVDMSGVEHIDAATTAALARMASRVISAGGSFDVTGAQGQPESQLELYGFHTLIYRKPPSEPVQAGLLENAGEQLYRFRDCIGGLALLVYDAAYWGLIAPITGKGFKIGALMKEVRRNGFDAVPVVALVSFLFGAVLSVNGAYLLGAWGQNRLIADMVSVSLAREVGPVLAAIMLAARSGSAISAEIGTMQVREEVNAMWVMGMNPGKFLVVPKIISLALVVPILALVANVAGMTGSFLVTTTGFGVPVPIFLQRLSNAMLPGDIFGGLGKGVAFGIIIGVVACWYGFGVRGGAEEVGRAATRAVVSSIVLIIVADGIFSALLYVFA